ncbi:MAG: LD-carboxypeptidase, partial [Massilia sp.]|nr:LD-carboxypeptidase [Massilia sp.]MDB5948873.1 LD-carboxypeptidase [Massilia sp.]
MSSSSKQISRRHFATLVAAALALPGAAAASSHPQPHRPGHPMKRHLIKPPRLLEGDLVGLIAPSGHTSDSSIEKSVRQIEALGFRCKQAANLRAVRGNYAGSVEQRLLDLHAMFADPEVKAIWCIRGGSGCISLLSKLDYALIRANPKVLLGYSDITALHLAIGRHAGLVTFHGPVASSTPSDYST